MIDVGVIYPHKCKMMIKKDIIDTVLSPFLIPRQVPYMIQNPDWVKKYPHLNEEPIEVYISSAYFASHWMSETIKLSVKEMFNKSEAVFLAFDYAVTLKMFEPSYSNICRIRTLIR